jgi:hypothetical protein
MVMKKHPTVEDLIGIEYAKLGFFREVQEKIGELHASNIELMRRKHHIQAILRGITDVMAVLSLDLRISSVNEVFHEVFGAEHPEGQYCYQVFRQREEPCPGCVALKARDTNSIFRELVITPVNGKNHHFEITASPLRNGDGVPCHILIVKRDVTLEKEYQAKYLQAEKMATVGFLAAGVAHEINNPLTAIYGFAEGLKRRMPRLEKCVDKELLDDFNEYIGIILKVCGRCQEIVQGLLSFSRQAPTDFASVDLNSLVADTLKLLQIHLKHQSQEIFQLELDDSLPPIRGDAPQLKQLILNLFHNALDAVREGGTITLRTYTEHGGWVVLAVEDTGCGVASEHLDKLFEPFFTTKPAGKGIGIGLSTCYNITREHGGEISVQSTQGQGSTFFVRLPRAS